ncbi:Bestrophin-like protein [Aphelenchoides besseyi]|nr:Bestrophin-like protein [Aphelenchoides besseyi]
MTVSYAKEAATATFLNFAKLMVKWRGSVWKLVIYEAIIWSLVYFGIHTIYLLLLRDSVYNSTFEEMVAYMKLKSSPALHTILLGFFTSITIDRWWACYMLMDWPDGLASILATHLREYTTKISRDEMKALRQTFARYILLSYIFLLRDICEPIKRRFPDWKDIGLLSREEEAYILEMIAGGHTGCKYAVPLYWICWMLKERFREESELKNTKINIPKRDAEDESPMETFQHHQTIVEVMKFRGKLGDVAGYDFIPSPILAYSQACILAVYFYLLQQLFARQVIYAEGHYYNLAYMYLLTLAEVISYLGWFKAALVMSSSIDSWLINRHWSVVQHILVEPWAELPDTLKFDKIVVDHPEILPHTVASAVPMLFDGKRNAGVQASMANLEMPAAHDQEQVYFPENDNKLTGL